MTIPMVDTGPIVVIGAGGHCREVLDAIEAARLAGADLEVLGVIAESFGSPEKLGHRGAAMLGGSERLVDVGRSGAMFVVAIGDGAVRRRFDELCVGYGMRAATVMHPRADAGRGTEVGEGCYLATGSCVMADARLGRHVHVNVGAVVSHDATIGDFSTLSPGTMINGAAEVGDGVFFGTGAVVLPGRKVGDGAVIGAGAVVNADVPAGATAIGVPARWGGGSVRGE